jgi:hypothetical protein
MIWTERFIDDGEFEMKTPYIDSTKAALPEGTLISHLDTEEVMQVEDHKVEVDDDGNEVLTITGRSLTAFPKEHRHVEGVYQKKRKMRRTYSYVAAAAVLLYNAIDNTSGKDLTRGDKTADDVKDNDFASPQSALDKLPNIAITDSVAVDGAAKTQWLTEGPLGPQLLNMMLKGDFGFRTIRPKADTNLSVVTVSAVLATRGDITRTPNIGISALCFDLYSGLDRTDAQSTNPRVIFNYLHGHFDGEEYFWSAKQYKTVIELMSTYPPGDVYRAGMSAYSGFARRVGSFDAGTPELPPEPAKPKELGKNATKAEKEARADEMDKWLLQHGRWENKRDVIVGEFKTNAIEDAEAELKKTRRVSMFTGDISPIAPYEYKRDYDLGDLVTLYGDYKQVANMVVSEFIRTEDADGDRGFPGLTVP